MQIDVPIDYSGARDEVDVVDKAAAKRRKDSGWWGDQRYNSSDRLNANDLEVILYQKSHCSNLDSPGVYMYVNKNSRKRYIGSAIDQTLFKRQQQHLCSASHREGHVGKFDSELSRNFDAAGWEFYVLPMDPYQYDRLDILDKERQLILEYKTYYDRYGYNTQVPGGQ